MATDFTQQIEFRGIDNVSKTVNSITGQINKLSLTTKSLDSQFAAVSRASSVVWRQVKYVGVAAIAAATSVFWLGYRTSAAAEDLLNLSQKTGVSVEGLQQLSYAADQSNTSAESLSMGFKFLNRSIAQATTDSASPAAGVFSKLGVSLVDANGKARDTESVFYELSDAFASAEDGPLKVNAALQLLGRAGSELIPFLNKGSDAIRKQGAEFKKYAHQLSKEDIYALAQFNNVVKDAMVAVKSLGAVIAETLIPIMQPLVQQFADWVAANRDLIAQTVSNWVTNVSDAFKEWVPKVEAAWTVFSNFIDAIGGWKTVLLSIGAFIAGNFIVGIVELGKAVGGLGYVFLTSPIGIFAATLGLVLVTIDTLIEKFPELARTAATNIDAMIASIQKVLHLDDKTPKKVQTYTVVDPNTGKARTVTTAADQPIETDFSKLPESSSLTTPGPATRALGKINAFNAAVNKPFDMHIKLDTENKVSYASIDSPLDTTISLNSGPIVQT